jgi:late competence protein required for DNA uptake (superfamily II DNA/RNA helicase)
MPENDQLSLVRSAIAEILKNGQENQHGDRQIVRARLDYLMELERRLSSSIDSADAPRQYRNSMRYFEPI